MDNLVELLKSGPNDLLTPLIVLLNITLAFTLGTLVAIIYRRTHSGLSYSQSFTQTLIFISTIISIVMMVIGASIIRAFALLGALSMIRFRTVVKDTKDTAYIFASLAIGMGAGTGSYFIAIAATVAICLISIFLYRTNFGVAHKIDFLLRFMFEHSKDSTHYVELIKRSSKRSNVLHIEPSGDNKYLALTYALELKKSVTPDELVKEISIMPGVSEVTIENVAQSMQY